MISPGRVGENRQDFLVDAEREFEHSETVGEGSDCEGEVISGTCS